MQTQIENKYFEDLRREMKAKNRSDMDRWRTSICKIAKNTKDKIAFLEEKEKKTLETMRRRDIRNIRKQVADRFMLDGLEMENAKSWPNLANLNQKIEADVVIPQTVLNYAEYQAKLQRLAMFADMGDQQAMQDVLDNQLVIERKNKLLQPLFRDIKSQIRHMSFTPEFEIIREYVSKHKQIQNSVKAMSNAEFKEKQLGQLKELYSMLLAKRQQKIRGSLSLRLKTLQQRLENIFELLNLWNQYVEVIYMPEGEVHMIDQLHEMEGRPEEQSYTARSEADDIQKRLKMLFKPDGSPKTDKEFEADEVMQEAYETVNEGETTDTTSAIDEDGLLMRQSDGTNKVDVSSAAKPKMDS